MVLEAPGERVLVGLRGSAAMQWPCCLRGAACRGPLAARTAAVTCSLGSSPVLPAPQDHAALHDAGVAAFYGPGTRVPAAALDMLSMLLEEPELAQMG